MTSVKLGSRTAATSDDQLIGRPVPVVSGCLQEDCHNTHDRGNFELVYRYPNNDWLAISPENQLVRLAHDTSLNNGHAYGTTSHHLPNLPAPDSQEVREVVQAMVEPYLVNKAGAAPGCYWNCTSCDRCRRIQVRTTLWLETVEQIRAARGGLAILSGLRSALITRTLRAGNLLCTCPLEG